MANFELRIYEIDNETLDEIESKLFEQGKITDILSAKQFVEYAEQFGRVSTLCSILSENPYIEPTERTYRAYLIDVDNEEAEPVRVDLYNTIISANKVISHRTDFNPRTSETYETPIIQYIEPVHA